MPRYDFRCRECALTFEVSRPMSDSNEPARCPGGHTDTVKLLSTVAIGGARGGQTGGSAPARAGGGCCGGGCCS